MTTPRKLHVTIDRLVVDGPVDERGLREAIAAELGGDLAGSAPQRVAPDRKEPAAAREIARQVQGSLPVWERGGPSR